MCIRDRPKANPWKPQPTDFPSLNTAIATASAPTQTAPTLPQPVDGQPAETETTPETSNAPSTPTTIDTTTILGLFQSMMTDVQKMITDMTRSVFDALIAVIYNVTEPV